MAVINDLINSLIVVFGVAKGLAIFKFGASFKLALLFAPVIFILERISNWGINNADYVVIVLSAILIDHALGSLRHSRLYDDDFCMRQNVKGLFVKLILVVMIGVLFEELHHLAGNYKFITEYTLTIARLTVFLYPFGSAIGNSRRISGGKFPPDKWFNSFEKFLDSFNNGKPK